MSRVEFQDFSVQVKGKLDDIGIAWLYKWGLTTASEAKERCSADSEAMIQLRKSYKSVVDESKGEAQIGSPLEAAFWEEYGTGEHAKGPKPGRKGWWIYIEGQASGNGGRSYKTKEEAEEMAAYIRAKYGKKAVVTNGRDPNYTLQKAFEAVKNPAIADYESMLKEGME